MTGDRWWQIRYS